MVVIVIVVAEMVLLYWVLDKTHLLCILFLLLLIPLELPVVVRMVVIVVAEMVLLYWVLDKIHLLYILF